MEPIPIPTPILSIIPRRSTQPTAVPTESTAAPTQPTIPAQTTQPTAVPTESTAAPTQPTIPAQTTQPFIFAPLPTHLHMPLDVLTPLNLHLHLNVPSNFEIFSGFPSRWKIPLNLPSNLNNVPLNLYLHFPLNNTNLFQVPITQNELLAFTRPQAQGRMRIPINCNIVTAQLLKIITPEYSQLLTSHQVQNANQGREVRYLNLDGWIELLNGFPALPGGLQIRYNFSPLDTSEYSISILYEHLYPGFATWIVGTRDLSGSGLGHSFVAAKDINGIPCIFDPQALFCYVGENNIRDYFTENRFIHFYTIHKHIARTPLEHKYDFIHSISRSHIYRQSQSICEHMVYSTVYPVIQKAKSYGLYTRRLSKNRVRPIGSKAPAPAVAKIRSQTKRNKRVAQHRATTAAQGLTATSNTISSTAIPNNTIMSTGNQT